MSSDFVIEPCALFTAFCPIPSDKLTSKRMLRKTKEAERQNSFNHWNPVWVEFRLNLQSGLLE